MASQETTQDAPCRGNPRVIMWCVPRSVSTAVTKCMSFVEDAEIWLEPYVLSKIAADFVRVGDNRTFPSVYEGNEDVYRESAKYLAFGSDQERYNLDMLSPISLKSKLDSIDPLQKFVFVKDMSFGMPPSRYQYLPDNRLGFQHFFLIRNPIKVYKSFRKGLVESDSKVYPSNLHLDQDVQFLQQNTPFFKASHELWGHFQKTQGYDPVIVDIDELVSNPAAMLPRLFRALGIPYSDRLLTWDSAPDVVLKWKNVCPNILEAPRYKMWFSNAFQSTRFKASSTTATLEDATPDVKRVVEQEMPYYEKMYSRRLTHR